MTMLFKAGSTYVIEGYSVDYIIADDKKEGDLNEKLQEGWKKTIYETKEEVLSVPLEEVKKRGRPKAK